jgi:hypothetical protein
MGHRYPKFDHPPLLAPGRHYKTLWDIKSLCVDDFPAYQRREHLYWILEEFVQSTLRHRIPCEIWIDGSFLTKKPQPSDLDAGLVIDASVHSKLDSTQKSFVDDLDNSVYIAGLDSFAIVSYPIGDSRSGMVAARERQERVELFGVEHAGYWLKGWAALRTF